MWRAGKIPTATSLRIRQAAQRVIQQLVDDGWSCTAVADAYGLTKEIIERYVGVRDSLPGVGTARIVLAGPVRRPRVGKLPAWPARRRLQGLAWQGWSTRDLAARLGVSCSTVSHVQSGRYVGVSARMDAAIRGLYRGLWLCPGPSDAASRNAVDRGWTPPGAWVDIDSRDDRPEGAVKGMRERPPR
jgi:hypothetical protein